MQINIHNCLVDKYFSKKMNYLFCQAVYAYKVIQNMIGIVTIKLFLKTIPVYEAQKSPNKSNLHIRCV